MVNKGVDGVGVEGGLTHKQLIQDDAQRPQVHLQWLLQGSASKP